MNKETSTEGLLRVDSTMCPRCGSIKFIGYQERSAAYQHYAEGNLMNVIPESIWYGIIKLYCESCGKMWIDGEEEC